MAMRRTLVLLSGLALLVGIRATTAQAQEEVTLEIVGGGGSSPDPQARAINTWIDQAAQAANHNNEADLQVQAGAAGANQNTRAIVQFDISRIPRSGIKSAIIHLWVDTAPAASENWDIDPIMSFISWAQPSRISWTNRTNQLTWTAPGGDFAATPCTITVAATGDHSCDVTSTFQTYFGGIPPSANYGYLIRDEAEDTEPAATTVQGTIHSNASPPATLPPLTVQHAPAMVVDFIQQVHSLTATPGSNSVTLNWQNPIAVGTTSGAGLHPYTGVVILRNANAPVEDAALIQDGMAPPAVDCVTPVNGTASTIIVDSMDTINSPSSFTDTSCGITNGNTYFYKVFAVASLDGVAGGLCNYSQNGNAAGFPTTADSAFVAEISATPGATPASQQAPVWIAPVRSAALNAPSIDPGNYAIVAADNFLVQGFNPTTGDDAIAPISIGGIVGGTAGSRMPVLESTEADFGPNSGFGQIPMTYLAADDSLVYDVGLETSGFVLDFLNPLGGAPVSGAYVGGVALQVKAFSNSGNTKPNDVMIMGTNVVATPTTNVIFAANTCNLSAANPTGTGCLGSGGGGWNITGGTVTSTGCSTTATPAICNLDVVTSTPFVDYKNNTVWVTSHNGNTTGQVASPDVWKIDANLGTVLAAISVGGDIDSSPTETQDQSLIFVGANSGVLYAFDAAVTDTGPPVSPHRVGNASTSLGDGAIKGFPLVASAGPPWLIVVSTNTKVQILSFDGTNFNNPFAPSTNVITFLCSPSSPVSAPNLKDGSGNQVAIIGCSDGLLHEINLVTGVDEAQKIVDASTTIGDPSLDISTNEVIVGSSDGRVFSFKVPF